MSVAMHPEDNDTFVSASLDGTLKTWRLGNDRTPGNTLRGHERGINCVTFAAVDNDWKIVSGADDLFVVHCVLFSGVMCRGVLVR